MVSLLYCSAVVLGLPTLSIIGLLTKWIFLAPLLVKRAFPLSQVPGPFWARFTRFWLWRTLTSGRADQAFVELDRRYGPLVRIGPNHLITSDPEIIRRITSRASGYIRGPWYDTLTTDFKTPNLVSERDPQKEQTLRKIFHTSLLKYGDQNVEKVVDEQLSSWIRTLVQPSKKSKSRLDRIPPIDLARSLSFLAVDIASQLTLGEPFRCVKADVDQYGFLAMIRKNMGFQQFFSVFLGVWNLLGRFARSSMGSFIVPKPDDGTDIGKILGVARKSLLSQAGGGDDAEHSLLSLCIERGIPVEDADKHALVLLSAGSELLGSTAQGIMLGIITNPRIYQTLKEEVDVERSRYNTPLPVPGRRAKGLPYLQACIQEGLRLYQPVYQLRERVVPPEGDCIYGRHIPGGTFIGLNSHATQLSKVYGPDPEVFRPERWCTEEAAQNRQMLRTLDLVFGSGPSKCMGWQIAYMELSKIVFELMRNFDMCVANPEKPWKRTALGVTYNEEFFVYMTHRDTLDTAF